MDTMLLRLARWLLPDINDVPEFQREASLASLFIALVHLPLMVTGIGWLLTITDWDVLIRSWPMVLFTIGVVLIFERFPFFAQVELRSSSVPASVSGTMEGAASWALVLLLGPSALWHYGLMAVVGFVRSQINNQRTPPLGTRNARPYLRLDDARRLIIDLAAIFCMLVGLVLYRWMGGTFPLPDLDLAALARALAATWVPLILAAALILPYLWIVLRSQALVGQAGQTESPRITRRLLGLFALGTVMPILADPFGILLAGLFTTYGWSAYLFLMAGLLLVAVLSHNLSRANQGSRQRTRELEQLEQLGRALIIAPSEPAHLPALLKQHVTDMFPQTRITVRLFTGQTLMDNLEASDPRVDAVWEWLRTGQPAQVFQRNHILPWTAQMAGYPLIVAPILHVESQTPIGGVCLIRPRGAQASGLLLPAVQTLAAQVASALHSAEVYERQLAAERLSRELALAGQIQASLLPQTLPVVPGWQIAASLEPARQTSGDFYDLIKLPDDRLGIVVADVADKGVGAALYMALSRTLIRTYAVQSPDQPATVLTLVNQRILQDSNADLFVTVFYGVVDLRTGLLTYCSAGHNPAYVLQNNGAQPTQSLNRTGIPLGMFDTAQWRQHTTQLESRDMLLLYTDGLTEAHNADGEEFGEIRMLETARRHLNDSAEQTQRGMLGTMRAFVGEQTQFDDITLVVVTRR